MKATKADARSGYKLGDSMARGQARRAAEGASSKPKGGEKGDAEPTTPRRDYEMGVVLGPPAHGKTSFVDALAAAYASRGGRVVVVDPNDAWRGVPHVQAVWPEGGIRGAGGKAALDDLIATFEHSPPAMLVLDDADKYARHATEVIDDLMTSFRHWKKDVVVVARRPQGIPKDSLANASWLALFACREVYARRYIAEQVGDPAIMTEIPTEPFRFLYVRQDGTFARGLYETAPRAVTTKSDREGA